MPIFYECQRCTACCRWPGLVRITDDELARLAAFKGLSEHAFIQQFMRLRPDRRGLALADKPNGQCIFLEGNDCSVQPVKPQQCRDFPNLWNFPGFEKICRAIPRLVGEETRRKVVEQAGSPVRPSEDLRIGAAEYLPLPGVPAHGRCQPDHSSVSANTLVAAEANSGKRGSCDS